MTINPQFQTAQHAAYRAGLCIDCQAVPYSAGRPRCNDCHAASMPSPIARTPNVTHTPHTAPDDTEAAH